MFSDQLELLRPENTFLFLLVAPLVLLGIYSYRVRRHRMESLGLEFRPGIIQSAAAIVVTLVLIAALLRPSTGQTKIAVNSSGADLVALVDISFSMDAKDVLPSRLTVARRKLLDLVARIEKDGSGDRLGLVLFAGEAYLYCPPTADYSVLKVFINAISSELISSGGSSLKEAIKTAIASLSAAQSTKPRLLILSDGEDLSLDVTSVVSLARDRQIEIDAIGIGTVEGTPIELSSGFFLKSDDGQTVITKLNEDTLTKLAEGTGGQYVHVTLSDQDLNVILSEKGAKSTRSDQTVTLTIYHEIGPYFVWLALLILFVHSWRYRSLLAVVLMFVIHQNAAAQEIKSKSLRDGYTAYNDKDYQTAQRIFSGALKDSPHDGKIVQSLGSTLYQLKDYAGAVKQFEQLKHLSTDREAAFDARYDLGNSLFNLGKFEEAIREYQDALSIKPDDFKAKSNRDLAKLKLKEKLEQKHKQDNKSNQNSKEHGGSSDTPPTDPSEQDQTDRSQNSSENGGNDSRPTQNSSNDQQSNDQPENDDGQSAQPTTTSTETDRSKGGSDSRSQPKSEQPVGDQNQTDGSAEQYLEEHNVKGRTLADSEAKRWLESLPDSPVLLQRKRARAKKGVQSW